MNFLNSYNLHDQIALKNGDEPYIPSHIEKLVITDHDNFPYNRYYRGKYDSDSPIVSDRQAGYRTVNNACYGFNCARVPPTIMRDLCWEAPCSTVYPCYPSYITKYSDKGLLDVMLNNVCIIGSR
jgi:hypothetical protein